MQRVNTLFSSIRTGISKRIPQTRNIFIPRIILFTFLLLVLSSISLFLHLKYDKQFKGQRIDYLAVVSATPRATVISSTKPKIAIKFNLPVSAHHIEEYFYLSPFIEGNLKQGSSSNEVVFEPEVSFPRGAYVTVSLKAGLPSDSGKKLLSDYSFSFTIDHDANTIAFTNKDQSGKFMSF